MDKENLWERCYNMNPSGWADYLTDFTPWNWYATGLYAYSETGEEYHGYSVDYRATVSKYFDDLLFYTLDLSEDEFTAVLIYQVLLETSNIDLINQPEAHKRMLFS